MIRRPPRSTRVRSSAASDVYKRQVDERGVLLRGGGLVIAGRENQQRRVKVAHDVLDGGGSTIEPDRAGGAQVGRGQAPGLASEHTETESEDRVVAALTQARCCCVSIGQHLLRRQLRSVWHVLEVVIAGTEPGAAPVGVEGDRVDPGLCTTRSKVGVAVSYTHLTLP